MQIFKPAFSISSFVNKTLTVTLPHSNQAYNNGVTFRKTSHSRFCTLATKSEGFDALEINFEEFAPHGDFLSPFSTALPELCSRFVVPSMAESKSPPLLVETRFILLSSLLPEFQSSGRFLARMGSRRRKWGLANPLTLHDYMLIKPSVVGSMKVMDCSAFKLSSVFHLIPSGVKKDEAKLLSKKVVGGWDVESDCLFSVLAQIDEKFGGGFVLWRLGDDQWSKIESDKDQNPLRVLDIAYHDGRFYVFDLSKWRIGVIDPEISSTEMEFIDAPGILDEPIDNMFIVNVDGILRSISSLYFVPSNEGLYLVIILAKKSPVNSETKPKPTMVVYLLSEDEEGERNWERKKSLGDQIFFIGDDVAFTLPSSSENLPEWKSNSLCFFTQPYPLFFDGGSSDTKMPEGTECLDILAYAQYYRYFTMFDMEEDAFIPFKELPMEVYTGLFFPPPPWIRWNCPTRDNAEVKLDALKFRLK